MFVVHYNHITFGTESRYPFIYLEYCDHYNVSNNIQTNLEWEPEAPVTEALCVITSK